MRARELLTLSGAPPGVRLAAAGALGVAIGMALFVARISEAASYLSDNPETCINCHVMFPEYATWRHSSHANVATCNDCHVPHGSIVEKYFFKAKDGSRHTALFILGLERQVIQATPESRAVIQENCVRCHSRVMLDVRSSLPRHALDRACVECHREVPHGRAHSLSSTPNAAVSPLRPVAPPWVRAQGRMESEVVP